VDRVRLFRADGEAVVHASFSASGEHFLYSAPPAAGAPAAVLRAVNTPELGRVLPRQILPDVIDWRLSNDGKTIYYLSQVTDGVGRLGLADFPDGANPRLLPGPVRGYVVLGADRTDRDRGLGVFFDLGLDGAEYRLVPDPAAPERSTRLFGFRSNLDSFGASADDRFTAYAKPEMGRNGYVVRSDGTGECVLNGGPGRTPYDYAFLAGGGLVFWSERSPDDPDAEDAWVADPDGCRGKRRFASRVAWHTPVGDRGVVFADEARPDGTVTLKLVAVEGGRSLAAAGAVNVRHGVELPIALVGPAKDQIAFEVARGAETEVGVYLLKLPF